MSPGRLMYYPQRFLTLVSSLRIVLKPYTFKNGITVPKGTTLAAPLWPIHMDDGIYENAEQFDGFRFSKLRERCGENAKYYAANTNEEYLQFGHGQHAWSFPF